jgi:hypothetical protein
MLRPRRLGNKVAMPALQEYDLQVLTKICMIAVVLCGCSAVGGA